MTYIAFDIWILNLPRLGPVSINSTLQGFPYWGRWGWIPLTSQKFAYSPPPGKIPHSRLPPPTPTKSQFLPTHIHTLNKHFHVITQQKRHF